MKWTPARHVVFLFVSSLFPFGLFAQTVCNDGNGRLESDQPSGITTAEIVQRFAAKETEYKTAYEHYAYTLDASIQTLTSSGQVDGTFRQVWGVALNDKGTRVEKTTFGPENSLREIRVTPDDLDDIRARPFLLPAEDLPSFFVNYVGQQHVDELDTYVFDVTPRNVKKNERRFRGRIWVDDRDFMIVKTCGRTRKDEIVGGRANVTPMFVTYRQPIDGQFWFPAYVRADQTLHFPRRNVYIREVIKYLNYKPIAAK